MVNILLVEDDDSVASFIKKGLEENQYTVELAKDGAAALKYGLNKEYGLIILDIMLPYVNGIEVCKQIRTNNEQVPILMLTALGTVDDKVKGLKAGADDYLLKPFHFSELLARIEALLRRKKQNDTHLLEFEDIVLNTLNYEAKRAGHAVNLTAKEFDLLVLFIRNKNKILSRQLIAKEVWGIDFDTGTNMIDVYVNYLRKKIEKDYDRKLIYTVIGKGYIFK
ncbi:response regulator transcription factor [uncultured Mucilaginibacter sp.]|uniref:response regulator transcription factor n=1 Tax=uncultured Mucilaginibacter sp. TaxID=797541 RepID=UPI00261F41FC|nr:response regulator transcription factor [uncultured Mucilaginibacter sp.]